MKTNTQRQLTLAAKILKDDRGKGSFYCGRRFQTYVHIMVFSSYRIYAFKATEDEAVSFASNFPDKNRSDEYDKWAEFFIDIIKKDKKPSGFFPDDIAFFEKYMKAQIFIKTGEAPKRLLYQLGSSEESPRVNFKFLKDIIATLPASEKKSFLLCHINDKKTPIMISCNESTYIVCPVNIIYDNGAISIRDFWDGKPMDYDVLCA